MLSRCRPPSVFQLSEGLEARDSVLAASLLPIAASTKCRNVSPGARTTTALWQSGARRVMKGVVGNAFILLTKTVTGNRLVL